MPVPTALHALLLSLAISSSSANAGDHGLGCANVHTLYQFPPGPWIENIAARSNGSLLLTRLDAPVIYQLDPFSPNAKPEVLVSLTDAKSVFGIAEIEHDVFAFSAGNFSFQDGDAPGSFGIRQIALDHDSNEENEVKKVAEVPVAGLLNGMTVLPLSHPPYEILSSDIEAGVVHRISPASGAVSVAVNNSLTAAISSSLGITGVNGIRISPSRPDRLYLANSGQSIFASIEVDPRTGLPTNKGSVIANVSASLATFIFDDFALPCQLDEDDAAYIVTGSGNSIERLPLSGPEKGRRQLVAGDMNSTLIKQPTSAAFGRTRRDMHVLYVVTGGSTLSTSGMENSVGAQILALDVTRCRKGRND